MFKKLKQRIEEEEQPNAASTPRTRTPSAIIRPQVNASEGRLRAENKWEKRRLSQASLCSSRESLQSVDSSATVSRSPFYYGSSLATSADSAASLGVLRDTGTKDDVLTQLAKKTEQAKKLEGKINELSVALGEQSRQKERLEDALQKARQELESQADTSMSETYESLRSEFELKLQQKDKQIRDCLLQKEHDSNRYAQMTELNQLQQEEFGKMKAMLIHSQTEMSRKTAELMDKTKQIENLDKQYAEQKAELDGLQDRLNELAKDRTKYETRERQFTMQLTATEKEKMALKVQLADLINELTEKSSQLHSVQMESERRNEELCSLRQTYNLYKSKASTDIEERQSQVALMKERISDLEQRLEDSKLSGSDHVKALEKERSLLESRLKETREQLSDLRTHSNDKISTLGSLVSSLDERVKQKEAEIEERKSESEENLLRFRAKLNEAEEKLAQSEKNSDSLRVETSNLDALQLKVKELEKEVRDLKAQKADLEVTADKAAYLESQNKLLDARYKETVGKLESDRARLEEKVRELQSEARKASFRLEHASRRKTEELEVKVEEQARRLDEYQQRMEELLMEKDSIHAELSLKEDECTQAAVCLEDAMRKTNELKAEITDLQEALKEKDNLITCIKESGEPNMNQSSSVDTIVQEELEALRDAYSKRESVWLERERQIDGLREALREREQQLCTTEARLQEFEENNKNVSPSQVRGKLNNNVDKELHNTALRLTKRVKELESQLQASSSHELEVANRALQAELNEVKQALRIQQQNFSDIKKTLEKEMKQSTTNRCPTSATISAGGGRDLVMDDSDGDIVPQEENKNKRNYLEVNFKYLKHVVLKYMCSSNDQSRQLIGVIGHLLQFTPRESAIVRDCMEWKLPLEKKK